MRRRRAYRFLTAQTQGFTLTEMFLCIMIVAVLTAILFPIFAKHRGNTQSTCMTNMKQIGLALIGYTQDYDGDFPSGSVALHKSVTLPLGSLKGAEPTSRAGSSRNLGVGWAGSANPYIKSPTIFKCDKDTSEATFNPSGVKLYPVSYAMNQWVGSQSQTTLADCATTVLAYECSGPKVNLLSVTESGGEMHSPIGDGASNETNGIPDPGDAFDTPTGVQNMIVNNRGAFARHDIGGAEGGGSMYLLGDGHVKFLRFDRVSVGKNPVAQSKLGNIYAVSFNPVN